jgi:hypothetical protein
MAGLEIASSADGQTLILEAGNGETFIFVSPNGGTDWYYANFPMVFGGNVRTSWDGTILGVVQGTIYLSLPPPRQPFELSVTPGVSNAGAGFELSGPAGYTYYVEASTDLVNWVNIATLVNTNGSVTFSDAGATNYAARFYRVVAP